MKKTGIVRSDLFIEHDPGRYHPESPARLTAIYEALDRSGLPLVSVRAQEAKSNDIKRIHTSRYFELVAGTEGLHVQLDPDTTASPRSFEAAMHAAGGLIALTSEVLSGRLDNGFALLRPPGHHAEANRSMGFCLFNNIAIAAAWARSQGLERIAIVDWDLHHGNATQHSFEEDDHLLYISTHLYPYFPGTGSLDETGSGKGRGYTINLPMGPGQDDQIYTAIFQLLVLPVLGEFEPELILVSAGFDTHRQDPMRGMAVSEEGYAAMTRLLMLAADELCGGRLVLCLEGGYNIQAEARSVICVLETLTQASAFGAELAARHLSEPGIINLVRQRHLGTWKF